jgi:hypothetical protein
MAPINFCSNVKVAILFFLQTNVFATMIFLLGVKWQPFQKFGNKQWPLKKMKIFIFLV